jgi:SH3-like domain-containing protein
MQKNLFNKAVIPAIVLIILFYALPARALCIKASEANLRQGPGTHYEKTGEGYKYMPLEKLKRRGDWYRVRDMDGDIYWIHRKLVTDSYKCAVVKDDKANIRSGPGLTYKQLIYSPLLKYYTLKVEKTSGKWVRVIDEYGDTGWIYKPLLWIR